MMRLRELDVAAPDWRLWGWALRRRFMAVVKAGEQLVHADVAVRACRRDRTGRCRELVPHGYADGARIHGLNDSRAMPLKDYIEDAVKLLGI